MEHRSAASLRSVTRTFGQGARAVIAVDDVTADISDAGLSCIAGPSGSGKSTLINLISCLDRPERGAVIVGGVDVTQMNQRRRRRFRRRELGLVASVPGDNLISTLDVAANLQLAVKQRTLPLLSRLEIDDALEQVGLGGSQNQRMSELSGGEQLRLAVACAIVGSPRLVVADEPTASLDRTNAEIVVALLRRLSDSGAAVIVATHDHHVLDRADSVIRLEHGRRVP